MSWFARSLRSLAADDEDSGESGDSNADFAKGGDGDESSHPGIPFRGVEDDLSELTETLTRGFWGVASFLAPPPPPSPCGNAETKESATAAGAGSMKSDLAEIGGKVRSGISMISGNKAVTEISKLASSFLAFVEEKALEEEEDDGEGQEGNDEKLRLAMTATGINEEVLVFVKNVALSPETWTEFPTTHGDKFDNDFEMSQRQQEHALAIELLVPDIAALRAELCPSKMSESFFWKTYFVLLYTKLGKGDASVLATPEILEARAELLRDAQNQVAQASERQPIADRGIAAIATEQKVELPFYSQCEAASPTPDIETEKHPIETIADVVVDKPVIKEELPSSTSEVVVEEEGDWGDEWLEEETTEAVGSRAGQTIPVLHEEDVSFSDLEEEDDDDAKAPA